MKSKVYIFVVLALSLLAMPMVQEVRAAESKEYQIKAAFLYNFIKFVDWPGEENADSNEPIIIGIIGKDPFGGAFEPIKDKNVKDRAVVIKRFKSFEDLKKSGEEDDSELKRTIESLKKCHLLFICSSESKDLAEIITILKASPILTVGEMAGFLEAGGMVNFLEEEKKIRFEINLDAAEQAGLKIRSKLLRLAKRIVKKDAAFDDEDSTEVLWAQGTNYVGFAKHYDKI